MHSLTNNIVDAVISVFTVAVLLCVDNSDSSVEGVEESTFGEMASGFACLHDRHHRFLVYGTEACSHGLLGNRVEQSRVDSLFFELFSNFPSSLTEAFDANGFFVGSYQSENATRFGEAKAFEAGFGVEVRIRTGFETSLHDVKQLDLLVSFRAAHFLVGGSSG